MSLSALARGAVPGTPPIGAQQAPDSPIAHAPPRLDDRERLCYTALILITPPALAALDLVVLSQVRDNPFARAVCLAIFPVFGFAIIGSIGVIAELWNARRP